MYYMSYCYSISELRAALPEDDHHGGADRVARPALLDLLQQLRLDVYFSRLLAQSLAF